MESFLARVCLKNGVPIDVKVVLDWFKADEHGYDFNYLLLYNGQQVPDANVMSADLDRITKLVDKKVANLN